MSELQHQTDVEQAKAKLQQVAETKEGRKDPRAGETAPQVPRKPATDEKKIRPVTAKPKKKKSRWWIPVVAVAGTLVVALAVFLILARVAPDFIDSILYTPEELRIINY